MGRFLAAAAIGSGPSCRHLVIVTARAKTASVRWPSGPRSRYDTAGTSPGSHRVRLHFGVTSAWHDRLWRDRLGRDRLAVLDLLAGDVRRLLHGRRDGQDQLYDEVTSGAGLKVAVRLAPPRGAADLVAASFDTMFTADIAWTVLQAIVWFGVFTLVFQFQPQHAAVLGTITFVLVAPLASMGVDSLMRPSAAIAAARRGRSPSRSAGPSRRRCAPAPAVPGKAAEPARK